MDTGQSSVKKIGFSPIMEAPQYKTNSTNSQLKSKNLNDGDPEACITLKTFDSMNLKTKGVCQKHPEGGGVRFRAAFGRASPPPPFFQ